MRLDGAKGYSNFMLRYAPEVPINATNSSNSSLANAAVSTVCS